MKQLFLLITFSFLTVNFIQAQNDKSQDLLDKVSSTIAKYDNIQMTFDYHLDNEVEKIHQKTSGNININGDKYHLNFMGMDRISDGHKIYSIIHEDEEVYISNADDNTETFTPSSILEFYKKGYRYTWGKSINEDGKTIQYINLTPLKEDEITYITLGIDTNTNHIHSVAYFDKKNTKITLKIRVFKPNVDLSAKEFVFDNAKYKEKNYSITEL